MGQCGPSEPHGSKHIDLESATQIVRREFLEGRRKLCSCMIDENIKVMELPHHVVNDVIAMNFIGEVAG